MSAAQILKDVALKCEADVTATIHRNMKLVDGGTAMSAVALAGASSALGTAAGTVLAVHLAVGGGHTSGDQAADALWNILRPMVVKSVDRVLASAERGK
ncbi:hypothetical protein HNO88_002993 [Novosphingobium chloroacetimidivorans]|uniref:Uncharacterized protein n=1 Tax=Novosphingobium chloroacetimidivorans TaxID=1428314 RepID=A0A7W7KBA1_9SPHN|nr:hypothetical protein [Novosphingobium chloroacetimidivorans]MBB4859664.1 hypothetical protein [Novosphingobium chloroacetimidivorans]